MGVVKVDGQPRPDRAIWLSRDKIHWPPPGMITSAEAARRIGATDANLRAMRARPVGQDRGPDWVVAPSGHHVAYTPQSVAGYLRKRAERLKAQADALLARVAEHGEESQP